MQPSLTGVVDCTSRFDVTFFANFAATRKTEARHSLVELRQTILETTAPSKEALPWLKLAVFGDEKTDHGSLRHNQNVLLVTGIEADYDAERIEFADAVARLRDVGLLALIYTSPSHTEDGHRWRVLCPFSQALEPSERSRMLARLNGLFRGRFAIESWTLSQSYYFGSVNHNSSHQAELVEGDPIDLRDDLDTGAIWRPKPNGSAPKEPTGPIPVSSHPPDERLKRRYNGLFDALLDNIRNAPEQQKHDILLANACEMGGHIANAGITEGEAVEMLVAALPVTVKDWNLARRTATDGLKHGVARPRPLLEDRPGYSNGHGNRPPPPPNTPNDGPADDPLPPGYDLPVIQLTAGLRHENTDAGLAAMRAAGVPFFVRNKTLVRTAIINAKTSSGAVVAVPSIIAVTRAMVGRAMGQTAIWQRVNQDGAVRRADPPKELTEQAMGMAGEWPFQPLTGVISTPTLRPDGSLLCDEGYDEATGLMLLAPPVMPLIPDHPTKDDAYAELKLLLDLLTEFPFIDEPSRSVGVSMLMTPVLRGGLLPAVPMHLASAPESGSGKSYLADTASSIATGDRCYVQSAAPGDPKETEKRLIGAALAGHPIIALDNCNSGEGLSGDFLCQLTERPGLQPRPLGGSEMQRIINTFTVIGNGNGVTLQADMVRRSIIALLDANMEDPGDRKFKQKPVETVLANRGRYVAACIIIARAYIMAGRPGKLPPTLSYEGWSDTVRSALVWLGMADPIASQASLRVEDPARQATSAVFTAWRSELTLKPDGFLATELVTAAETRTGTKITYPLLREALLTIAPQPGDEARISGKRLGWWLRGAANKVSNGMKLTADRRDPSRTKWILGSV